MGQEMRSFENFNSINLLFWCTVLMFGLIVVWSITFELDKSVTVNGEIKPRGMPHIVQNRFEGKVAEIYVSEGQTVTVKQNIMLFSTDLDATEKKTLVSLVSSLTIKIARLQKQLKRENDFIKINNYDDIVFAEQHALLQNELLFLDAQISLLNEEISLKEAELEAFRLFNNQLEKEIKIAESQYDLSKKLFAQGFEGKIAMMQKESDLIKSQNAREENKSKIELAQREIELIEERILTEIGDFRKKTLEELVAAKEEKRAREVELEGIENRLAEFYIEAPISGQISTLSNLNIGQIFKPGEKLAEIIPEDMPLVFYAKLPVQFVDEVYIGQETNLLLSTGDVRKQVPIKSQITEIAPDASAPENENTPYYDIRIDILEDQDNIERELKSGVTGTASILFGKRTVVEYFLEPLLESMSTALSEN